MQRRVTTTTGRKWIAWGVTRGDGRVVHRVELFVDGLGVVSMTSAKPVTIYGAIAELCDQVLAKHVLRA